MKLSNVLAGLSYIGVPVTAYLTHTGTKKAIENSKDGKQDLKYYIPAAVAGVATVGCGIASHKLDKKEIAKLTALAAATGKAYDMYRNANIKVNGREAHEKVMEEVNAQKAEDANIADPCFCGMYQLNSEMDDEERLFYDTATEQFFTSTLSRVIDAEYHVNRWLTGGGFVGVDLWCKYLGIENPDRGDRRGWMIVDDLYWMDFDNSEKEVSGVKCIVIEPCVMMQPEECFADYV